MSEQQPDPVDVDHLTYTDDPVPALPPPGRPDDVKVPRTFRLPVDLDSWITATATAKGVQRSDLVRDLLELGREAFEGADRQISLADVLSALASIRSRDAA
jgi:hypothetical protein